MPTAFHTRIAAELAEIDAQGLTKPERVIHSRQGPVLETGCRRGLYLWPNK